MDPRIKQFAALTWDSKVLAEAAKPTVRRTIGRRRLREGYLDNEEEEADDSTVDDVITGAVDRCSVEFEAALQSIASFIHLAVAESSLGAGGEASEAVANSIKAEVLKRISEKVNDDSFPGEPEPEAPVDGEEDAFPDGDDFDPEEDEELDAALDSDDDEDLEEDAGGSKKNWQNIQDEEAGTSAAWQKKLENAEEILEFAQDADTSGPGSITPAAKREWVSLAKAQVQSLKKVIPVIDDYLDAYYALGDNMDPNQ